MLISLSVSSGTSRRELTRLITAIVKTTPSDSDLAAAQSEALLACLDSLLQHKTAEEIERVMATYRKRR